VAEQSPFLIFISREVSHGAKTISRRKGAGRRDHPNTPARRAIFLTGLIGAIVLAVVLMIVR
jgi:hypothetical protein